MKTYIDCTPMALQFMCQKLNFCPTVNAQTVVCCEAGTGKPLAGVIYDAYNGAIVMAHIWVDSEHNPSREWFAAIFDYPFNRLGVHKIVGQVNSANSDAIKLDTHFGFELECKVKGFYEGGGDLLVYTMTRDQCRILNSPAWAKVIERVSRA